MAILGTAFNNPKPEVIEVGIVEPADTMKALVQGHEVRVATGSIDYLESLQRQGEIKVILSADRPNHVLYQYDPSDRAAIRARDKLDEWIQAASGRVNPVTVINETVTLPGSRYVDFLVPGLLALSIMTSSLFGTGAVLVVSRREQLLKRYLVTPMRTTDYLLSHVVGRLFMLAVEGSAILIAARVFFGFKSQGHWGVLILLMVLGAAAFTSLAALLASRTSNMAVMNGLTNLIVLPMMLLSGVWFSRANFPDWLSQSASYLPLSCLTDGLRRVMLEGVSLVDLSGSISVLVVFTIVVFASAMRLFKWYD
jgi:ABC-type multidrug transport system permease subunit